MKTSKLIAVVLFVLLTAQIASAYYCPSTGRWLSRDPLGEPGFENLRATGVVPSLGRVASSALSPGRWINRDLAATKKDPNRYVFVFNDPMSRYDVLGLDCPGCDYLTSASPTIRAIILIQYGVDPGPLFSSPCALRACAQHDQCYCQNSCSMSSWGSTLAKVTLQSKGIPVSYTPCDACNLNVVYYMVQCVTSGGNYNSSDPQYFCAKQGKFITIPGDFPTLAAAKCACCGTCPHP